MKTGDFKKKIKEELTKVKDCLWVDIDDREKKGAMKGKFVGSPQKMMNDTGFILVEQLQKLEAYRDPLYFVLYPQSQINGNIHVFSFKVKGQKKSSNVKNIPFKEYKNAEMNLIKEILKEVGPMGIFPYLIDREGNSSWFDPFKIAKIEDYIKYLGIKTEPFKQYNLQQYIVIIPLTSKMDAEFDEWKDLLWAVIAQRIAFLAEKAFEIESGWDMFNFPHLCVKYIKKTIEWAEGEAREWEKGEREEFVRGALDYLAKRANYMKRLAFPKEAARTTFSLKNLVEDFISKGVFISRCGALWGFNLDSMKGKDAIGKWKGLFKFQREETKSYKLENNYELDFYNILENLVINAIGAAKIDKKELINISLEEYGNSILFEFNSDTPGFEECSSPEAVRIKIREWMEIPPPMGESRGYGYWTTAKSAKEMGVRMPKIEVKKKSGGFVPIITIEFPREQ